MLNQKILNKYYLILFFTILLSFPGFSYAEVNIFACEPEWKALAEEIGGNNISAISATTVTQDPHHIRAKPSLIAAMRKADIVICSGAGLEIGWLPVLLQKAGSAEVQNDNIGSLMASDYVKVLEKHSTVDRSQGDVHPEGNPHVHLDPNNLIKVAEELSNRLSKIDAANSSVYSGNLSTFKTKWSSLIEKWKAKAASLNGSKMVVYHKNWVYLFDWLNIKEAASLEPKPGIPPSVSHLEKVLESVKTERPSVIISTPYEDPDAAEWLSERSGIPYIVLPYTIGGEGATNLESLFDITINKLLSAQKR